MCDKRGIVWSCKSLYFFFMSDFTSRIFETPHTGLENLKQPKYAVRLKSWDCSYLEKIFSYLHLFVCFCKAQTLVEVNLRGYAHKDIQNSTWHGSEKCSVADSTLSKLCWVASPQEQRSLPTSVNFCLCEFLYSNSNHCTNVPKQ